MAIVKKVTFPIFELFRSNAGNDSDAFLLLEAIDFCEQLRENLSAFESAFELQLASGAWYHTHI